MTNKTHVSPLIATLRVSGRNLVEYRKDVENAAIIAHGGEPGASYPVEAIPEIDKKMKKYIRETFEDAIEIVINDLENKLGFLSVVVDKINPDTEDVVFRALVHRDETVDKNIREARRKGSGGKVVEASIRGGEHIVDYAMGFGRITRKFDEKANGSEYKKMRIYHEIGKILGLKGAAMLLPQTIHKFDDYDVEEVKRVKNDHYHTLHRYLYEARKTEDKIDMLRGQIKGLEFDLAHNNSKALKEKKWLESNGVKLDDRNHMIEEV
jgi:hypothetical protein